MPSSTDHCGRCGFEDLMPAPQIEERIIERNLVDNHLTALANENSVEPPMSQPGVSARRVWAARQCAQLIYDGLCPIFGYKTEVSSGRVEAEAHRGIVQ